jgi:hypothetical protein
MGSIPGRGSDFFSSPPRADRLWDPPNPLSSGCGGAVPPEVKLSRRETYTHRHLMLRLRTHGAILPLPHTSLWHDNVVNHRGKFTFTFIYLLIYSLTHSLTPWCSILLEKLTVTQLVKNILLSYGTRSFITVFTNARRWTLS